MKQKRDELVKSLEDTWTWFKSSKVMDPLDGRWGLAERVLLTENNSTRDKTFEAFPAWTHYSGYSIIEQRRADCNMEAAFLFLLMGEQLKNAQMTETGKNLLFFLYHRSGLLWRQDPAKDRTPGVWQWAHINWTPTVYWDDNSWMCALQLMIADHWPELDRKYDMRAWGLKLARTMAKCFLGNFNEDYDPVKLTEFVGTLCSPHWGSMLVLALGRACRAEKNPDFEDAIDRYHHYLMEHQNDFTVSEQCYVVLGALSSWLSRKDSLSRTVAEVFGRKILETMDPETGTLPSQHYEAPTGGKLADTIYTLNWAILAFQGMGRIFRGMEYRQAFDKMMELLLKIQDHSPEPWLYGCWRGMYDMEHGKWGGGDCFEGGANSIYTGWTNAPIPWAIVCELMDISMLEL